MNITKYLILGLTLTISGVAYGADAEKKRKAAIIKAHEVITHEELDAAEADGLLPCPLVIDRGGITHTISLACSIMRNPKASAAVLNVCLAKGNGSSIGVIIKLDNGFIRERPLLCDLLQQGSNGLARIELNSLPQLRDKCKAVVASTDSPLKGIVEKSEVLGFVALLNHFLSSAYAACAHYQKRQMYDEDSEDNVKYALTMTKAVFQACNERYKDLPEKLDGALHMFSRDLVKLVGDYLVPRATPAELVETDNLERFLVDPRAKSYLQQLEAELGT